MFTTKATKITKVRKENQKVFSELRVLGALRGEKQTRSLQR